MKKTSPLVLTAAAVAAVTLLSACATEKVTRSTTTETTYETGYTINSLPAGYTTYTNSGDDYYVVGENYFRRTPSGYTVVETPSGVVRSTPSSSAYSPGYVTRTLPAGYTTRSYRGADYYIANGNYYRRDKRGYVVVAAPM
jgi:hypothetical protein